jgi:Uma2 family endonuclease
MLHILRRPPPSSILEAYRPIFAEEWTMITEIATPSVQLLLGDEPTAIDASGLQGLWSDAQYLRLTESTNRLIELTDGVLEMLPMPTRKHQAISRFLLRLLLATVEPQGGTVFYSPLRMQIRPGKYREPDLLLLLDETDQHNQEEYWLGADLVIEIVSPNDRGRDTEIKPNDYAEARIPEYWIVDPTTETITVLRLAGEGYVEHGVFRRGDQATSALIPEFTVAVDAVLDA